MISDPIEYDQAVTWIARLMAHYPRRDVTKDRIIVEDIAGELAGEKITHSAVAAAYKELWKAATNENPFFPSSGEILKVCKDIQNSQKNLRRRLVEITLSPAALKQADNEFPIDF